MGTDIHLFVQVKTETGWKTIDYEKVLGELRLNDRCYSRFAFLANVRNYDCCMPLSKPKGFPPDMNDDRIVEESDDCQGCSYFTLSELFAFDYEQIFENRRVTRQTSHNVWNGACIAEKGEGKMISYRENLGEGYFESLEKLKTLGDSDSVRIVFFFGG